MIVSTKKTINSPPRGAGAATYSALDNDTATTAITGPLGGDPNESNTPVEAPAGSVQAVAASVLPTVVSIIVQEGNAATTSAKIALARATGVVISAGLAILGVTPVEEMR